MIIIIIISGRCARNPDINLFHVLQEFEGTMKTGQDRVDYFLDAPILASVVKFQILEYNDELNKCARVEVRGCSDTGKNLFGCV